MNRIGGIVIMILGYVLAKVETKYFGNNISPNSLEEFILDLCCLFIFLLGVVLFVKKDKLW